MVVHQNNKGGPMGNLIQSLKLASKSTASKIALGTASFMVLTVIGSATLAGATPVTGTTQAPNATSLQKQDEKDNNKDHQKNDNNSDNGNKDHNKNKGNHGYGGTAANNVTTNITANQSGNDNVFSVIINYIFG